MTLILPALPLLSIPHNKEANNTCKRQCHVDAHGLTWYHAKLGILKSLQSVIDAGVLSIERVRELL